MSQPQEPITEIDLLAYADGSLAADPQRHAEVEQYLHDNPEVAVRVDAFARQDKEIRGLYDPVLYEPVPERLRNALVVGPRHLMAHIMRGTVAASVLLATGMTSWYLGRISNDSAVWQREAVVHSALSSYQRSVEGMSTGPAVGEEGSGIGAVSLQSPGNEQGNNTDMSLGLQDGSRSTSWLSGHIALQMRLPDLSAEGFQMAGNQTIPSDNGNAVKISYINDQGQRLVLMLHPRWRTGVSDIQIDERGGVAIASWADGPLAYGLASDGGVQRVFDLAGHIRHAMREPGVSQPALSPDTRSFPEMNDQAPIAPDRFLPGDFVPEQQAVDSPLMEGPVADNITPNATEFQGTPVYQHN